MNYKNMSKEEILYQLEWSDQHEFSYGYAVWAFKKLNKYEERIDKAIDLLKYGADATYLVTDVFCNDVIEILKGVYDENN